MFHVSTRRLSVAAAAVAALSGATVVTVALGSAPATATPTTVTVPAGTPWTDTGVSVATGQSITIAMSGTIDYLPSTPSGPGGKGFASGDCGYNQYINPPGSTYPFQAYGVKCWGSLFKIGSTGIPFPTGTSTTFTAPVSGELYIGINDNYFPDNSGSFTATISH